jgi:alpha-L-rhamnosidase
LRDGVTYFEPKFTYHGFRYMEMRGEPKSAEFEACFVHDEVRQVGSFSCSNPLINDIVTAAARGIRGNYRSMPTDCPQRDERMGWLGDRAGGAPGEMFLFDVSNVYRKWMDDIRESQAVNGCVPDIAPPFWKNYSDNITWPSCVVFIPHWLRRHYGDGGVIEQNFDAITRWLDHMCEYLEDGLLDRDIYGDWCVPPEEGYMIHSERADRKTSPFILASAYLAQNLELASAMAERMGKNELAVRWRAQRGQIAEALNARFLDADTGRYDNGSQTGALLPLAFEVTPEPQRKQVFDYLVSRIEENGAPVLGTGLVGGQWLLRTLTAYGRADIALSLVAREEYPSWGYMIRQGATTIWELWNGNSAEPFMNSRNHVMLLGDLLTWLFEDVAGIQPRTAGFEQITLRPHFILDSVDCKHESIRGPIHSRWETKDGKIEWSVSLPPNVETFVELRAESAKSVLINGSQPELVPCTVAASPFSWVQTKLPTGTHRITLDCAALPGAA